MNAQMFKIRMAGIRGLAISVGGGLVVTQCAIGYYGTAQVVKRLANPLLAQHHHLKKSGNVCGNLLGLRWEVTVRPARGCFAEFKTLPKTSCICRGLWLVSADCLIGLGFPARDICGHYH